MKANSQKLNREEFNVFIENIPLSQEDKQTLKESGKYLYDFTDFICKKFNTTPAAAEAISELNTSLMLKDYIEKHENLFNSENDVLNATAEIFANYAKSLDFPDYEKLGKATVDMLVTFQKLSK